LLDVELVPSGWSSDSVVLGVQFLLLKNVRPNVESAKEQEEKALVVAAFPSS
jgi:hypothetical protein